MRILHVNDTKLKLGGAETYIYELIESQKNEGHEVKLFGGGKFNTITSFLSRFYDPCIFLKFLKTIDEFKPDVIHAHGIMRNISPSFLHAAKLKRIPVVMTVHDFHLVCPTTWFIFKSGNPCECGFGKECFLNVCQGAKKGVFGLPYNFMRNLKVMLHRRIIRNNVDFFITPSDALGNWVRNNLGIEDVKTIAYSLKMEKSKKVNIPKKNRVLFVGRLYPEKGVEYLLKVIPLVSEKIPDVKFIIVGSGPEERKIRNQIEFLDVEDKVEMVGWVKKESIPKFYRDSSLVVVPSIWMENFGLVAVEAMSQGKPLIVSKFTGGLKELVEDGVNGYLANVKNTQEFSSKIIETLSDSKKLRKFSEKSLELSSKYLDMKSHLRELEEIYKTLI